MTTQDDGRVFIKLNHNFQPPGITIDHKPFDGAVEYITLADHTRLVKEAVEAERAAAKSMVWTLGHEIKATMLVEEDNEQAVLDMVKATAAAIRNRGVTA